MQIKRILMRLSNTYHWSDFYKKTIGENEIKNNSFVLKNMSSGNQVSYNIDKIEKEIKKLI